MSSNSNGSTTPAATATTNNSSEKFPKKMNLKMKAQRDNMNNKEKVAVELSGKMEVVDSRHDMGNKSSSNGSREVASDNCDVNKDEVEEGELGTMDVENGVLLPEKSFSRKLELKSEIKKGEFDPSWKWRRRDGEKGDSYARSWRGSSKDESQKGDRERWRRSEVVGKDGYGYSRTRRHDSTKENGWKGDREWTSPSSNRYSSDKDLDRSVAQHVNRSSKYYSSIKEKTPRFSSKIAEEEGSLNDGLSNGRNHGRECSSRMRLKDHGGDSDGSELKHRGEYDDFIISSKSRKLTDEDNRSAYTVEKYSRPSVKRTYSSRKVSSDRYPSRHCESSVSSRNVYDRRNSSPNHQDRSPLDGVRYHDHRDWSPARHDRSPYDRSGRCDHSRSPYNRRHYDHSRSPYDRKRYYDHRNRSPSYSKRCPQDEDHCHRRDRTPPSLVERFPLDQGRPQEAHRRSERASEKQQSRDGSKGQEENDSQKDLSGKDSKCLSKESDERNNLNNDEGTMFRTGQEEKDSQKDLRGKDSKSLSKESEERNNLKNDEGSMFRTCNDHNEKDELTEDELTEDPNMIVKASTMEHEDTEVLASMEEDMDICNTPPHVPAVVDSTTRKWSYIDHFGVEQGPSRLCVLRRLMEEGFIASDHFIKHIDCERWVTVENAVSPMVTPNFPSVVPDTVTKLVSPPEAPGNMLADTTGAAKSADEIRVTSLGTIFSCMGSCHAPQTTEDLQIDERVEALLDGISVIPGRELERVGEVLQMSFEFSELEKWGHIEGEHYEQRFGKGSSSASELVEAADPRSTLLALPDKDTAFACGDTSDLLSNFLTWKIGDWKRYDEAVQDRSLKRKVVLNDGYPLCQMPKFGLEDPRWQEKDDLYNPSQSRRLDLLPWAFTSSDEWNERASESKPALVQGVKGSMLPVIRINACVVKDNASFVSEASVKVRGKERYSLRESRPYSANNDMNRLLEESVPCSTHVYDQDFSGVWKSSTSFRIPEGHVCRANELQMHLGGCFYLDGSGHEHGPLTFWELQTLADGGVIQKYCSVFRKVDKIWFPVSSSTEASEPAQSSRDECNATSGDTWGSLFSLLNSSDQIGTSRIPSIFHDLHPQFIGYTRGKLHELVMKSYKSREFAASINEFLDPWINARQPNIEMEKKMFNSTFFQKSDQFCASKRAKYDGSEDEMEDVLPNLSDECSFDELCGDATFTTEDNNARSDTEGESWGVLDGCILARVFHFLGADIRSLVNAASTCKSWRSVIKLYKNISSKVELFSVADRCNDSSFWSILNGYNKEKIKSLILRGCTNVTPCVLEQVLCSFPHLSMIDIRGCSHFEDLACKYPNFNWVRSRGSRSKLRRLKQMNDASKTNNGLDRQVDESSGLRNYLESSDRRESATQLFHRSLYRRSKLFDARKASSILSRDAHLRRLAMRKYDIGYKGMAEFLASSLKDIMKQNPFDFFVRKVAQIEGRVRKGYYASHGLSSIKEDIRRMCRDAIKIKNRGNARDMNRIITLFIRLATSLDGAPASSYERDEMLNDSKDDSPPGFSSASSQYRKALCKRRYMNRSNGSLMDVSDYGEFASDREIRRRLSKLNKKPLDSNSDTSDDYEKSSDGSTSGLETTASEKESDMDSQSESGIGESRGEAYAIIDDGFDTLADDREWGARMTKTSLVPPVTRKYEVIDHYVIVADEEEVNRKMKVSLPDNYAVKLISQRTGTEESDMEIPEVKDYKPRKQLGDEVIEQEVYGIDPYTHNLLLDSMPEHSDWSLHDKHTFIEYVLLPSLNKQIRHFTGTGNVPMMYTLKPIFEEILETAEEDNDRKTMRLCQYILKAIAHRPEDKYVAYRKGLGVVCNKESGFSEEDFVVEFLGEVYPAWKWFEKQDGIRALQKNSKDSAPEFYNIYLERPKGDADGYDLVIVDAMHKANYASRICHSCRPNCEAKVTAVDGQYQIGIYTVRPIGYGEEVTFDYNSVTESKEEYEASVCLCGSQICRGSYLNLTGEGAFQKVLKEYHGILDRLYFMLESCELNSVSEEDLIDLGKAGLGRCLLGGLPDWLIAYSARLVRFINFERAKLPDEILKHNLEEKKKYWSDICLEVEKCDAEVQAEGVYNHRLQNLALTLDKVRYVMKGVFGDPKKAPPPLERLSPKAVISFLWKGEGSLVEELIQCITPHVDDTTLHNLKADIHAHDPSTSDDIQTELKKSLIWLRDEIRNLQCDNKCRHDAAADLLHIYAHTKCFFRIREYRSLTSPPLYISPLDLCPKYADKVDSSGHEYSKTYGENYCLGQLIYWHVQTNAEPDSCLARASRGCLSLPEIGAFYAKVHQPSRQRVYGPRTLKFMLARMEKQAQRAWPKDRIWSFKSCPKVIGSPMLDAVIHKVPLDEEMVQWLKHRPPIFQATWDR